MDKSAQKVFDRADIVRDVRLGDKPGLSKPECPNGLLTCNNFRLTRDTTAIDQCWRGTVRFVHNRLQGSRPVQSPCRSTACITYGNAGSTAGSAGPCAATKSTGSSRERQNRGIPLRMLFAT